MADAKVNRDQTTMQAQEEKQVGQPELPLEKNESLIAEEHDAESSRENAEFELELQPQPSSDPNDPLNWSPFKKHMILLTVSLGAFVGDFGLSVGISTVVLQSQEWNLTPNAANYPNSVAVFMIGIGSLIWMPLTNSWGRAPVFFWTTLMGVMFTLGCLLTHDFKTYYAMRALQAATQAIGSTMGLVIIHDLFFFHEHARKIGLWYVFFLVSPFAGPLLGNFIIAGLGEWRPVFWLLFALSIFLLAMTFIFFDETRYNRSVAASQQPPRSHGILARISRVIGIWQLQNHAGHFDGVAESYWRLIVICFKPIIPITVFIYGTIFMWSIGINQSSAVLLETPPMLGGYGLSPRGIGYIYFTPIVATLLGWVLGHFYNDYLVRRHLKRYNNIFSPFVRLWATYPMAIIMIPGLILVGQTLQKHLHWVGIVFGWGMYQAGVMVLSVAVVAFIYDCYPDRAGEVSAVINFGRAPFGFVIGYFQAEWGVKQGFDVSFGLQGVVTVVCFIAIGVIHRWGRKLM